MASAGNSVCVVYSCEDGVQWSNYLVHLLKQVHQINSNRIYSTKKLCYRSDDRAVHRQK